MNPKLCMTAAGVLLHEGQVLLVKHKKLGIWLNPGGHIEQDELPHHAAEREFFEETGVRVEAYDFSPHLAQKKADTSFFIPNPLTTNVHWICKENYEARCAQGAEYQRNAVWSKGCEKHCNFLYLVRPTGDLTYTQNEAESDGIGWFTQSNIHTLKTHDNIRTELELAFNLFDHQEKC